MTHVVDVETLRAEGWLSESQAQEIVRRSRDTMVHLAVNCVLFAGIIIATTGLVFWLSDPVPVAVVGLGFLLLGSLGLVFGASTFRMIANASAIVGAGMLLGGLAVEMYENHAEIANAVMIVSGAVVATSSALFFLKGPSRTRFAAGTVLVMGVALHLVGLGSAIDALADGWRVPAFLYAAAVIGAAGLLLDVRLVTGFAVLPLMGALATRSDPFDLDFLFDPPDAGLTILMMAGVAAICLWIARSGEQRIGRHMSLVATLALISINLCFLIGSWTGDGFGQIFLDPPAWDDALGVEANEEALRTYRRGLFFIPENVFIVSWLVVLIASAIWAARRNLRGVFNATIVFGAVHVAGQVLEHQHYAPAVWALIGLATIPVAWGMWRANLMMNARDPAPS